MTRTAIAIIAVVVLFLGATPAWAHGGPEPVQGRWAGAVPCIPMAVDLASGETTCVGSSTWAGSLIGQTHYTFTGTVDLVTGAGEGTIDETFVGHDGDGRVGTLRFSESVALRPTGLPDTGSVTIKASVVGSTGGFSGARGSLTFVGTTNLAGEVGSFAGHLTASRP